MSQAVCVIIDRGISEPVHGIEVVDGLNAIEKRFLLQLMSTVKLLGEKIYDTQIVMHTGTRTYGVSLSSEFQKHISTVAHKHGFIDQEKCKKRASKKSGKKGNIKFRMMLMYLTKI